MNSVRVLLLDKGKYICSHGRSIYEVSGGVRRKLISLPVPFWKAILMRFDFFSRLLRLGVHHLIYDGSGGYFCVYNDQCARFSSEGKAIGKQVRLVGNRPLRVDLFNGAMIYGEYHSNVKRRKVSVFSFDGYVQKELIEVPDVRHIHAVRVHGDKIYFSTGDYEDEAGIWCWDGSCVSSLIRGGQQCRAVDFLLINNYIYYATDTPLEENFIYCASFNGDLRKIQRVGGSVFYMSEQAGRFWLATVVEPSVLNVSKYVELWASEPGDIDNWRLIKTFKKDLLPMKLFQYGQIKFPSVYHSSNDNICFYLQGVAGSGKSVFLSVN